MSRTPSVVGMVAACTAAAPGQSFNFEPPTYPASPPGTVMTGTDGWYLPAVAGSGDGRVYTYAANELGLPPNPGGADQFQAGTASGTLTPRAQRNIDFVGSSPGSHWDVEYDFAVRWSGATLPAVDNIGSWSIQDSATARGFQTLMTWGTTGSTWVPPAPSHAAAADRFHHAIGYYADANATAITQATPSAAWRDLMVNNWYRVRIRWNFATSRIIECSIQDITGGGPVQLTNVQGSNWYLRGGPNSPLPFPTAIRLFAGGTTTATTTANTCAFDNLKVTKVSVCYADCNNSGSLTIPDFACFQSAFVGGNNYADCNNSGTLTIADFSCFQAAFTAGCS